MTSLTYLWRSSNCRSIPLSPSSSPKLFHKLQMLIVASLILYVRSLEKAATMRKYLVFFLKRKNMRIRELWNQTLRRLDLQKGAVNTKFNSCFSWSAWIPSGLINVTAEGH
ncbi:uncharacterized protein LOC123225857 [Mangifera indica]|uniref:uncharacterized protein LOC123225857 n=1 Tax=Mangifera indica TaxID=29780 RepID=UPI001CFB8EBA|nr:uncharacterized protein LOC123225857 [Mangifera indica]